MTRHIVSSFVAGSLALALCACDRQDAAPEGTAMQMPATRVTIADMTPTTVTLTGEMAGRTVSYRQAEVRPEVGGLIRERCFQEGSDVQEGDVLYLIEPDTYQAAHDSAKAALAKAEANLNAARLKDQRTTQLFKTNSVSRQDYDDAHAAYLQAQAEVAACQASLRSAEIDLERTQIRAPISGRIGKSSVSVGALVTVNQTSALATIHQTMPMNVDLTQSVDEMRGLRKQLGMGNGDELRPESIETEVNLILSDGSAYPEAGTLRFADVGVDEGTGTCPGCLCGPWWTWALNGMRCSCRSGPCCATSGAPPSCSWPCPARATPLRPNGAPSLWARPTATPGWLWTGCRPGIKLLWAARTACATAVR